MRAQKVAVVTGANRGIGREVARQLAAQAGMAVVLTGRDRRATEEAAAEIAAETGQPTWACRLDVTVDADAEALAAFLGDQVGRVDALVNNAGAILRAANGPLLAVDSAAVLQNIDTNAIGALRVTRALAPLLRQQRGQGGSSVVNVSSGMGAMRDMGSGHIGYRLSKVALNALTILLHHELSSSSGVRVNAVCPGWVQTDMGGPGASRSVQKGAEGIVWAATLASDGPSGGFFRDGRPISW